MPRATKRPRTTPANGQKPSDSPFESITDDELDHLDFQHNWIIDGVLVAGQLSVVGGAKKCLKTSVVLDAAVSIATGTPFLGHFTVPKPRRVAVFSGESGEASIKDTVARIKRSKRAKPGGMLTYCFSLPQLNDREQLKHLASYLRSLRAEVVIVDPLYLCLGGGIDPANL